MMNLESDAQVSCAAGRRHPSSLSHGQDMSSSPCRRPTSCSPTWVLRWLSHYDRKRQKGYNWMFFRANYMNEIFCPCILQHSANTLYHIYNHSAVRKDIHSTALLELSTYNSLELKIIWNSTWMFLMGKIHLRESDDTGNVRNFCK